MLFSSNALLLDGMFTIAKSIESISFLRCIFENNDGVLATDFYIVN